MGITKKELLKMIDDSIYLEDKSIPIYRKHMKTALFWSGLSEWDQRQLNVYLNALAGESAKHSLRLAELKAKLSGEARDVF